MQSSSSAVSLPPLGGSVTDPAAVEWNPTAEDTQRHHEAFGFLWTAAIAIQTIQIQNHEVIEINSAT